MRRLHGLVGWGVVLSQISHLFCCGLPIIFGVLGLLSGVGIVAILPAGIYAFHEAIHGYEARMMLISAGLLLMGWATAYIAYRIDCHDTGCSHSSCTPKKERSNKILAIATGLFIINAILYFSSHT